MTGNRKLVRGLTLYDSTSIVICSIIGTGVFLKTGIMAQYTGSPLLVMAAWMAAGLLSLAGALTYAELGAMLPKAGGDYVYLQTAYGEGVAFLYGWMYITVGASGAAALAAAFAMFLASTFPIGTVWIERTIHLFGHEVFWQFGIKQVVAIAAIIFCGALNCAGVSFSGSVQSFITTIKVLGVLAVIALVFLFSKEATWENLVPYTEAPRWCGIKAFGAAMLASLWAYNGWTFLGLVAGEVKKPEKNIPRAIITGMLVVLVVYMLANLSYFYALPFDEVMTSNSTMYRNAPPVATKAVLTFLGPFGFRLITILFIISTIGTLHTEMLVIPRISYAMARDGLFFSPFGRLSKRTRVPVFAVCFKVFLACLLACSGTFDQLTTLLIFALWIFYGMTASSVFVLRRKMNNAPQPYRMIGYPVVPFFFVLTAVWLVVNTLLTNPLESMFGLMLILPGVPLYYYFRARRHQSRT